jgi:chromosomal replication initiator protein
LRKVGYGKIEVPDEEVIRLVADRFFMSVEEMMSASHKPRVVTARAVAMWVMRQAKGYSFPKIGRVFGRNHSTVLFACRQVERHNLLTAHDIYREILHHAS